MQGEGGGVVANWSWRAAFGFVAHAPPRGTMLWKRWGRSGGRVLNNDAPVRPLVGPDIDVSSRGKSTLLFENSCTRILRDKNFDTKDAVAIYLDSE